MTEMSGPGAGRPGGENVLQVSQDEDVRIGTEVLLQEGVNLLHASKWRGPWNF